MEHASMPRHRPLAFDKMEKLIKEMQDPDTGVPVRCQKLFLSVIPSAFMGYDLVEWLMDRYSLEETSNGNGNIEAISIASQLCQYGYFFPVNDSKNLVLKDDSSLYRFQSPYYWPWQTTRVAGSGSSAPSLGPDNVEYAIYLVKRTLRNKQRHALEDYEQEALANLKKNLAGKWDFITMQAEEQVRLAKDRKKGEKVVSDSQERAYWRVARPPPGVPTALEPCPVPVRTRNPRPKKRTIEQVQREIEHLKASLDRTRVKTSIALEAFMAYSETFASYDPWLTHPQPSNPWINDDTSFWQINSPLVEVPSEKRVQRWAISIEELLSDPTGLQEFTSFLRKEYSHENIRFWLAVKDLRRSSTKQIQFKLVQIYEEFLKPGAPCEINIDGATADRVNEGLRARSRYAFDHAADHVYGLLLKKDCYPRFIRSDHFQRLLTEGKNVHQKKAKFFNFGSGQVKKKPGAASGPLSRRRGSDRSLTGSAHELAACAVQPQRAPEPPPHSHSQSNLADIPFRDPLDDSVDDAVPWESVSREVVYGGARRRQDSAADSGSSSSDISACVIERTRRLPQQSTLDGGLRGAPPPLRRLSAVEPRHLSPAPAAASPPPSPRPPPPAAAPPPAAPPHPTPTISVSSAPDDDSPSGAASPERRSLAHSDEPSSVFASADATPTEPVKSLVERRDVLTEKTFSTVSCDLRTDVSEVEVRSEESPATSASGAVPRSTRVARDDSRDSDRSTSDDVSASVRRRIFREPSTTRELSPASSKDSIKIGDLPGGGAPIEEVPREVRVTVAPAQDAVSSTAVLDSTTRPGISSVPVEKKVPDAGEANRAEPEPVTSKAPTPSQALLLQQQASQVPLALSVQAQAAVLPRSSALPESQAKQGPHDLPESSTQASQPVLPTQPALLTQAVEAEELVQASQPEQSPQSVQPLQPQSPHPVQLPQPVQQPQPHASQPVQLPQPQVSQPAQPAQQLQPTQLQPALLPPVAPLAVGEDIGVDDDNVDKVPSAPVQRVSGNSRTASESDATKRIAHKDELSSVSDSDIVKRDNKSELAEHPQRNDICPWEDENSCESDAPFVKTYATLGYL